ncbi:MAG: AtuA-related protein [Rhodoferax sp.]
MLLREIAHSRAGDKGNRSTLSVIVYDIRDYPRIERCLTAQRVREHYADIVRGEVERYAVPHLGALNFVLHDSLSGGVTRSLALDAHGKCLSSAILGMSIE